MPSKSGLNGPGLISVAVGAIFLYTGVRGISALKALQNVIKGNKPGTGQSADANAIVADTGAGTITSAVPVSGSWTHPGLMKLWQQAGGPAGTANNAACHAIQESGGNPKITSSNPDGGTNVGLWQLDTKGVGAGHTIAELQDAMTNARITVRATNGGRNWSEWATPGC